jgi:predicted transcriptional regulator
MCDPHLYISLTDEEKTYALRCVATAKGHRAGMIGISSRALQSLCHDGLLVNTDDLGYFYLTKEGRQWIEQHGGEFHYG